MDAFRPILLLTLSSLIPALSGSASSNDTLVVDIGDQFELLKLEVDEGQTGQQRWPPKHGFECDFDARSKGLSLRDRERQVARVPFAAGPWDRRTLA